MRTRRCRSGRICSKGGGELKHSLRSRLNLESLDGRIVPSGNPTDPPEGDPVQTPTISQQEVTDIAVFSLAEESPDFANIYLILEKAGSAVVVTLYDTASNTYYTGTESVDGVLAVPMTADLSSLLAQTATPGNLSRLMFTNADGTVRSQQQVMAGWPPSGSTLQVNGQPAPQPQPPPAATLGPVQGTFIPGTPAVPGPVGSNGLPIYRYPVVPGPVLGQPVVVVPAPTTPVVAPPWYFQTQPAPGTTVVTINPRWIQPAVPQPGQGPIMTWFQNRGIYPTNGGPGIGGGIIIRPR